MTIQLAKSDSVHRMMYLLNETKQEFKPLRAAEG